jgi:hypothetical protein
MQPTSAGSRPQNLLMSVHCGQKWFIKICFLFKRAFWLCFLIVSCDWVSHSPDRSTSWSSCYCLLRAKIIYGIQLKQLLLNKSAMPSPVTYWQKTSHTFSLKFVSKENNAYTSHILYFGYWSGVSVLSIDWVSSLVGNLTTMSLGWVLERCFRYNIHLWKAAEHLCKGERCQSHSVWLCAITRAPGRTPLKIWARTILLGLSPILRVPALPWLCCNYRETGG